MIILKFADNQSENADDCLSKIYTESQRIKENQNDLLDEINYIGSIRGVSHIDLETASVNDIAKPISAIRKEDTTKETIPLNLLEESTSSNESVKSGKNIRKNTTKKKIKKKAISKDKIHIPKNDMKSKIIVNHKESALTRQKIVPPIRTIKLKREAGSWALAANSPPACSNHQQTSFVTNRVGTNKFTQSVNKNHIACKQSTVNTSKLAENHFLELIEFIRNISHKDINVIIRILQMAQKLLYLQPTSSANNSYELLSPDIKSPTVSITNIEATSPTKNLYVKLIGADPNTTSQDIKTSIHANNREYDDNIYVCITNIYTNSNRSCNRPSFT